MLQPRIRRPSTDYRRLLGVPFQTRHARVAPSDLAGRQIGQKAAQLLTRETFRNLTRLDLSECKLTDAVVSALLSAPTLQNLIELHVSKNGLKDGLRPLTDPSVLPRLAAACVSGNRLPRDLERKLLRRPGIYV